jgi:hypothetical protein
MKKFAFAVLLTLACSSLASADQIFGTAGSGFQTWTTANLNEDGTPFWDNTSTDGPQKNIGYCMAGGGGCTISPLPGALPYWGTASGGADTSVYFGNTGPLAGGATMLIEIAGLASTNEFGWVGYDPLTNSLTTGLNVIFTGSDTAGASATFTPSAFYLFFIQVPGTGDIYFTNSAFNKGDSLAHFAIFDAGTAAGSYYLGMEDLRAGSSDRDFNDMVVYVSDVPEPASLMLLGSGLLGVGGFLRKKIAA